MTASGQIILLKKENLFVSYNIIKNKKSTIGR